MPNLVTLEATQAEDEEEWFWAVKNLRWKEETEKIFERGKKNLRKQRTEEREREGENVHRERRLNVTRLSDF